MKTHDLKTVVVNHIPVNYFYIREKNDVNGNPRFRVYIIDPESPAVYEYNRLFRCYESQIQERVKMLIEEAAQ